MKNTNQNLPQYILSLAEEKSFSLTGLAERLKITPQSMNTFKSSHDCSVNRLKSFSKILDHNFFTEIADEMDISTPKAKSVMEKEAEILKLQETIEELKLKILLQDKEIEVLNRSIKALGRG
jgi:cell division protein FtsL